MARNEEKHYGKLNRLILCKEKEEYYKKNPPRPKLNILNTPEEIAQWLPSIKRDIDFYLKKSMVPCYSDDHVEECREKVNSLEREFKAFVRKLAQLAPGKWDAVPWTPRAYKRKTEASNEGPAKKTEFVPIHTPILEQYENVSTPKISSIESPLMDKPLDFDYDKMERNKCSDPCKDDYSCTKGEASIPDCAKSLNSNSKNPDETGTLPYCPDLLKSNSENPLLKLPDCPKSLNYSSKNPVEVGLSCLVDYSSSDSET